MDDDRLPLNLTLTPVVLQPCERRIRLRHHSSIENSPLNKGNEKQYGPYVEKAMEDLSQHSPISPENFLQLDLQSYNRLLNEGNTLSHYPSEHHELTQEMHMENSHCTNAKNMNSIRLRTPEQASMEQDMKTCQIMDDVNNPETFRACSRLCIPEINEHNTPRSQIKWPSLFNDNEKLNSSSILTTNRKIPSFTSPIRSSPQRFDCRSSDNLSLRRSVSVGATSSNDNCSEKMNKPGNGNKRRQEIFGHQRRHSSQSITVSLSGERASNIWRH